MKIIVLVTLSSVSRLSPQDAVISEVKTDPSSERGILRWYTEVRRGSHVSAYLDDNPLSPFMGEIINEDFALNANRKNKCICNTVVVVMFLWEEMSF